MNTEHSWGRLLDIHYVLTMFLIHSYKVQRPSSEDISEVKLEPLDDDTEEFLPS